MPKVTFELTPQQRRLMDGHPEVNWSAVFRQAIERHAAAAALAREIEKEMADPRVKGVAAALKSGTGKRWRGATRP